MMWVEKSRNACVDMKLIHLNFGGLDEPDFASQLGNGWNDLFAFWIIKYGQLQLKKESLNLQAKQTVIVVTVLLLNL